MTKKQPKFHNHINYRVELVILYPIKIQFKPVSQEFIRTN